MWTKCTTSAPLTINDKNRSWSSCGCIRTRLSVSSSRARVQPKGWGLENSTATALVGHAIMMYIRTPHGVLCKSSVGPKGSRRSGDLPMLTRSTHCDHTVIGAAWVRPTGEQQGDWLGDWCPVTADTPQLGDWCPVTADTHQLGWWLSRGIEENGKSTSCSLAIPVSDW